MHPHSTKSHYSKHAGLFTSTYAIDTILPCVLIFHCHHQSLYWRRFLTKSTLYEWLWGYEIWCYTINSRWDQSLFPIKTSMPIPIIVYGNSFQWAKYGHLILPSNLDLTSNNKAGLQQIFWNCLIEFLHTNLDGNLSSALNPLTASKLDHYLSIFLGTVRNCKQRQFFWSTYVKWKKTSINSSKT